MAKRVYFAFHYQDVADFRANVVRNHNVLQGVEAAGYYDASIWEESRKQGNLALKRLINRELEYTSVTAVLIGSYTYQRPWVRYEIFKSLERGNRLLGIHINGITDRYKKIKAPGPNPFEHLGVYRDGKRGRPVEWNGAQWSWYTELEPWDLANPMAIAADRIHQLSESVPVYDWILHGGYENFGRWVA